MSKLHFFTVILFFISSNLNAQNADWVNTFGGDSSDVFHHVVSNANGDIYSVGYYRDSVDFDPSGAVDLHIADNSISANNYDVVIQKTSSTGSVIWTKSISGANFTWNHSIVCDVNDNIYFGITHAGQIDVDPGPGVTLSQNVSNFAYTLIKLDSNGDFVWSKDFDSEFSMFCYDMIFDSSGDLLLTGKFSGAVDLDPNIGEHIVDFGGTSTLYVLKLDTDGNFQWEYSVNELGGVAGLSIDSDAVGNIYVAGTLNAQYLPPLTYNLGNGVYITCNDEKEAFVLKINVYGVPVWAKHCGDEARTVKVDDSGNIYLLGKYTGATDLDSGPLSFQIYSETTATFLEKFDVYGNLVWGFSYPIESDWFEMDQSGNFYLSGYFDSTVVFNQWSSATAEGGVDACILKLNSNGSFLWVKTFGGALDDHAYKLELDNLGNIALVGDFQGTVDFGPIAGNAVSNGKSDMFVLYINNQTLAIESPKELITSVHPNPTSNFINVVVDSESESMIQVFDLFGKVVVEENSFNQNGEFDLSHLSAGVYIVEIESGSRKSTHRIIKN